MIDKKMYLPPNFPIPSTFNNMRTFMQASRRRKIKDLDMERAPRSNQHICTAQIGMNDLAGMSIFDGLDDLVTNGNTVWPADEGS